MITAEHARNNATKLHDFWNDLSQDIETESLCGGTCIFKMIPNNLLEKIVFDLGIYGYHVEELRTNNEIGKTFLKISWGRNVQ